jgi:hypothetical protein
MYVCIMCVCVRVRVCVFCGKLASFFHRTAQFKKEEGSIYKYIQFYCLGYYLRESERLFTITAREAKLAFLYCN